MHIPHAANDITLYRMFGIDYYDAIMLSGETAAGKHPVEAVEAMARIAEQTEKNINYKKRFLDPKKRP